MLTQTTHYLVTPPRMPHGDPLSDALALAEARDHCDGCRSYAALTDDIRHAARTMSDADWADCQQRQQAWRRGDAQIRASIAATDLRGRPEPPGLEWNGRPTYV
jgi:hypothetical protein